MEKSHLLKTGWTISLFLVILYVVCVSWSYLLTDPAVKTLHQQFLGITFPGFTWLTPGSFIFGLVLSFVYGWVGAIVFVYLHKFCCGKNGKSGEKNCCRD